MSLGILPPLISAQINYLLSNSNLLFKVGPLRSGSKIGNYFDRFTLLIPFCLDYVKWDVIYNAQYPLVAPDIVFMEEDEGFNPLLVEDGDDDLKKSSLYDWSNYDQSRLLSLVNELRELYLRYQKKRIAELDDDRIKFEISTLLSKEGLEVCLFFTPDRVQPQEVKFAIPLLENIVLSKLVQSCPWKKEQKIYLQAIFPITQKYCTPSAPRLVLVSTYELKAFFPIEDVKLPAWFEGMCMAEYLPLVESNVEAQILEASASISARRRFIEALAPLFGRPLEADPVYCRRATVSVDYGGFNFLVHFSLSHQFPKQQPVLIMQSCYHFNSQSAPISSPPLRDYPWSPRWEASRMAERVFGYIVEEAMNFKKYCSDSIAQPQ